MAAGFDPNTGEWNSSGDGSTAPNDSTNWGSSFAAPQPSGSAPAPSSTPTTPAPSETTQPMLGGAVSPLTGALGTVMNYAQQNSNGAGASGGSAYPTTLQSWQSYSNPTDQNAIQAYAQWLATQPGADPSLASQAGYLAQRISQTGGLTAGNVGYWATRTQAGNWTAPESAAGTPGGSGSGTASSFSGFTPTTSPMSDAGNAAILKLLQTPQTVDATTVAESPEAQAERAQSQRSAEQQIAASAEQAAQNGELGSGGEQGMSRQILANQAGQDTQFAGTEAATMRQQQIQQLEAGIQYAEQSGQFDKSQQLQQELAQLQASEQADQLGFNYSALGQQSNAQALQILLGGL